MQDTIKEMFARYGTPLAAKCIVFPNTFVALSRFGYTLDRFDTFSAAESYTLHYYANRPHLT